MFTGKEHNESYRAFFLREREKSAVKGLFLFLLSPFLAVLAAATRFGDTHYRYLIVLFFGFVGLTYMPTEAEDAYRNGEMIISYAEGGFGYFIDQMELKLAGEQRIELFRDLLAFFLSLISSDPNILFAVWGMIYGLIFVKFFDLLYREYIRPEKQDLNAAWFLVALAFYMPVMQVINGRFWLAYGLLLLIAYWVVAEEKPMKLLYAFPLIFIHQGIVLGVAILAMFVGSNLFRERRNVVFYGLIVVAYLFQAVGIEFIRDVGIWLGGGFERQAIGYIGAEEIRRAETGFDFDSQQSWFVWFRGYFMFLSVLAAVMVSRFGKIASAVRFDSKAEALYSFYLLFWAFQVFVAEVPSMGGRYMAMLNGVGILLLFMIYRGQAGRSLRLATIVATPAYLLHLVVEWRIWFEWTSSMVLFGNPFFLIFVENEPTIWELIPL